LPAWFSGANYTFASIANQQVIVAANGSDIIVESGSATTPGGNVASNMQYSLIGVVASVPGIWQVDRHIGSWSLS
jgi:hypothetical protein